MSTVIHLLTSVCCHTGGTFGSWYPTLQQPPSLISFLSAHNNPTPMVVRRLISNPRFTLPLHHHPEGVVALLRATNITADIPRLSSLATLSTALCSPGSTILSINLSLPSASSPNDPHSHTDA